MVVVKSCPITHEKLETSKQEIGGRGSMM